MRYYWSFHFAQGSRILLVAFAAVWLLSSLFGVIPMAALALMLLVRLALGIPKIGLMERRRRLLLPLAFALSCADAYTSFHWMGRDLSELLGYEKNPFIRLFMDDAVGLRVSVLLLPIISFSMIASFVIDEFAEPVPTGVAMPDFPTYWEVEKVTRDRGILKLAARYFFCPSFPLDNRTLEPSVIAAGMLTARMNAFGVLLIFLLIVLGNCCVRLELPLLLETVLYVGNALVGLALAFQKPLLRMVFSGKRIPSRRG